MEIERSDLEQLDRPALIALVLALQTRVAALEAQVAELRGERPSPPPTGGVSSWVRPARPAKPGKGPRRPRPQSFARRREPPTQVIEHAVAVCPACGAALCGGEVVRRRQVLHLPRVPAQVIEHVVRRRICPHCHQAHRPDLTLDDQVLGQHRVSLETMAYIATLHTVGRLPLRTIQWVLEALHGLHLSVGGLVGILRAVAGRAQPALDALQAAVRASPVVHADETGWREDGVPGYVWTCSTPAVRYFHHDPRRAGAVVQQILGSDYDGTLVSDFYGAYNVHTGSHQRCWVHLLRDIHDLVVAHPDDTDLAAWARAIHALYADAKQVAAQDLAWPQRVVERTRLDTALWALCRPGLDATLPQTTVCQRIDRFLDELFEFVLYPGVPPDNNLAERSLRPLVVARKISGGTRSAAGSQVRMALASLFGTWLTQGRDPLNACVQTLRAPAV